MYFQLARIMMSHSLSFSSTTVKPFNIFLLDWHQTYNIAFSDKECIKMLSTVSWCMKTVLQTATANSPIVRLFLTRSAQPCIVVLWMVWHLPTERVYLHVFKEHSQDTEVNMWATLQYILAMVGNNERLVRYIVNVLKHARLPKWY